MRILVLDGSKILRLLVQRLVPEGVSAEVAQSFSEAVHRLEVDPPDALIVNLSPSDLPWSKLYRLCHRRSPPIPILFESCVFRDPNDAGLKGMDSSVAFLAKPYDLDELRQQIDRLLAQQVLASTGPSTRS